MMGSYCFLGKGAGLVFVFLFTTILVGCGERVRIAPIVYGEKTAGPDRARGVPHKGGAGVVVKRGDSLYKIAQRYGVNLRRLIDENKIKSPYIVYPGQQLSLPKISSHVSSGWLSRNTKKNRDSRNVYARTDPNSTRRLQTKDGTKRALYRSRGGDPKAVSRGFIWPVNGPLLSKFGSTGKGLKNDGVNISARAGTPVRATQEGVVAYAGNELRGFGNLLLVRHADGWISAYAHNSKLLVEPGDKVYRGQVISHVGNTGSVNFPQLHFELRRGKRPVDPERYLKRQRIKLKG